MREQTTGEKVYDDVHPETEQKCRRCGDINPIGEMETNLFCSEKCEKEARKSREQQRSIGMR